MLTDTELVCEVGDLKEDFENLTPYMYKTPVSSHLAAKLEANPISLDKIKAKYSYLKEKHAISIIYI